MPRLVEPRLVKVRSGARGSGWAVGTHGVLTAGHIVEPYLNGSHPHCLVLPGDGSGSAFDCTVVWSDSQLDLALLAVVEGQRATWGAAVGPGPGPAMAEVGTDAVAADAVGYPNATVENNRAHPEMVAGRLLPAGGALSGLVPFDVDTSVPEDSTLWKGMSGAAVRDRQGHRLRGIVVQVNASRQQRRLYVRPLPDPDSTPDWLDALAAVGAARAIEAADAPEHRRLLALLDSNGRPYPAGAVPDVGLLGARRARTDIDLHGDPYYPYVSRQVDQRLAAALGRRLDGSDPRMLLVVGPAMTGKSRTLAHAVAVHPGLSGLPLLKPHRSADLREVGQLAKATGALLWLDNIETYGSISAELLHDWRRHPGPLVVVGTLRRGVLSALQDRPELRSTLEALADEALSEQFDFDGEWAEADLNALRPSDRLIRERVSTGVPLGEVLGAADELRRRLEDANTRQAAVVHVVIDWRRTGLTDPLPPELLLRLWRNYLPPRERSTLHDLADEVQQNLLTEARQWACDTLPGLDVRLVQPKKSGLDVDDYLIVHRTAQGHPVHAHMWQAALQHALTSGDGQPQTLLTLGNTAALAQAYSVGRQSWESAAMGSGESAALAQVNLGAQVLSQDPARARQLFEQALDTGHRAATPMAQANLGGLLMTEDPTRARQLLEDALRAGDPLATRLRRPPSVAC